MIEAQGKINKGKYTVGTSENERGRNTFIVC